MLSRRRTALQKNKSVLFESVGEQESSSEDESNDLLKDPHAEGGGVSKPYFQLQVLAYSS